MEIYFCLIKIISYYIHDFNVVTWMPWFLPTAVLSLSLELPFREEEMIDTEPLFREEEMIDTEHINKTEAATSAGD